MATKWTKGQTAYMRGVYAAHWNALEALDKGDAKTYGEQGRERDKLLAYVEALLGAKKADAMLAEVQESAFRDRVARGLSGEP